MVRRFMPDSRHRHPRKDGEGGKGQSRRADQRVSEGPGHGEAFAGRAAVFVPGEHPGKNA